MPLIVILLLSLTPWVSCAQDVPFEFPDEDLESRTEAVAAICLQAETQSLHPTGQGGYQLRNGPYMRRFLDGYYPMLLTLQVDYPAELIRFTIPWR